MTMEECARITIKAIVRHHRKEVMTARGKLGQCLADDLSMIGLDDMAHAAQTDRVLMTVALPRYEVGAQTRQLLLGRLNQSSAIPDSVHVTRVRRTATNVEPKIDAVEAAPGAGPLNP